MSDDPNYQRVHWRLSVERKPASEHKCIQCGRPAEQWAYQHSSDEEKTSMEGWPYSENLYDYEPMCRSCHRLLDLSMLTEEEQVELLASQRRGGEVAGCKQLRQCSCGLVSHAAGIGRHQKASHHTGWTQVREGA